jgi:hypothetical protein
MSEITEVGKAKHSPWDNKTSASWLNGIEYRVLEDPDDIYDYVNTVIRKELETDLRSMGASENSNEIIDSLAARKWKLEIVNVHDIQLNPKILESYDNRTGQRFKDRLKERTSELRRVLGQNRAIIRPLVLIDSHNLLIDGYCRHSTLTQMEIPKAYGYSGRVISGKSETPVSQRLNVRP